jgi:hypothetical protein
MSTLWPPGGWQFECAPYLRWRIDGNAYSVPWRLIGEVVRATIMDGLAHLSRQPTGGGPPDASRGCEPCGDAYASLRSALASRLMCAGQPPSASRAL